MTLPNPLNMPRPYRIYGHTLSFFTRKLTGFMTYKGLPWLQRVQTWPEHILQTDWPGGMPVVETPEGGIMWDTTAMILHLYQATLTETHKFWFALRSISESIGVNR